MNTYSFYLVETQIIEEMGKRVEDPIRLFKVEKDVFNRLQKMYIRFEPNGRDLIYKAVPYEVKGNKEEIIERLIFNIPLPLGVSMREANDMLKGEELNQEQMRLINEYEKGNYEKINIGD